ncbi:MAG TPA: hypothetical protein VKA14_07965 [Gammaproteobacteria bacterium]|nr:hypothetical protein [Gammaproteobacteria bacterium]
MTPRRRRGVALLVAFALVVGNLVPVLGAPTALGAPAHGLTAHAPACTADGMPGGPLTVRQAAGDCCTGESGGCAFHCTTSIVGTGATVPVEPCVCSQPPAPASALVGLAHSPLLRPPRT